MCSAPIEGWSVIGVIASLAPLRSGNVSAGRDEHFLIGWRRLCATWDDPPAALSTPVAVGSYIYEPCDEVDRMPDYENVLTD